MQNLRKKLRRHPGVVVVGAFLLASLVVVWGLRFLPLQDYPQNLFQAKLTAQTLSGHPVESSYYDVHLKATYSVFFLAVWLFQAMMPLAMAGKAAVSIYLVLVAILSLQVWRMAGHRASSVAVLMFPAAFNQIYLLGFFHYLYAAAILVLALLHLLKSANGGWKARGVAAQLLFLVALLWLHPFTVGIYGAVAAAWMIPWLNGGLPARRVLPGVLAAAVLSAGWILSGFLGGHGSVNASGIYFQPLMKNAAFLLYLFTGMRGPSAPDYVMLILWLIALATIVYGLVRRPRSHPFVRPLMAAIGVLVVLLLATPFGTANVSYLNVRLAVPIYFLLVCAGSFVQLPRGGAVVLYCATGLLLLNAFGWQSRMARETAEIEPIVAAMKPDQLILPLLFDRDSAECDGYYFSIHLNDHFYYHLAKGGASPYLIEMPGEGQVPAFLPVSFKAGVNIPAPPAYFPTEFRWEKYGSPYQYFLVRGGSESLYRYMDLGAELRVISGKWRLYEKR